MNCRIARSNIRDGLAAGVTKLPAELAAHQESCAECRRFAEEEQRLFQSLDRGLQELVSAPVPPSLLPAVRARCEAEPEPRASWLSAWGLAAMAATVVLLASAGLFRHHAAQRDAVPMSVPGVAHAVERPVTPQHSPGHFPRRMARVARKQELPMAPHVETQDAPPEVIVLAEEREAFARFVAQLPKERDVALALTNHAPSPGDIPVEVALLEIKQLHVPPLEPTETE